MSTRLVFVNPSRAGAELRRLSYAFLIHSDRLTDRTDGRTVQISICNDRWPAFIWPRWQ